MIVCASTAVAMLILSCGHKVDYLYYIIGIKRRIYNA